jgi:hypothetical protein
MKRMLLLLLLAVLVCPAVASADQTDPVDEDVETVEGAVQVTIVKAGGSYSVAGVSGGGSEEHVGCAWTVVFSPDLDDTPYGTSAGPMPTPDSKFALLLCNGSIVRAIWVQPDDIVDLDAVAEDEAQRYIEDVLVPNVRIGVNPAVQGLVGLRSWFWIEGFDGSITAPPITAFGMTIDVRMSSGTITWDYGDGVVEDGDLGRPYPAESSVQHAHQDDGTFTITATIDLVPEYRVNGGPWLTLPGLQAVATTQHDVEERQAVITRT